MFCSKCGKQVDPSSRFCPACGATIAAPPPPPGYYPNRNQLTRPRNNRMIARVCASFALHYRCQLPLARILPPLVALFTPPRTVPHLHLHLLLPEDPPALPPKDTQPS